MGFKKNLNRVWILSKTQHETRLLWNYKKPLIYKQILFISIIEQNNFTNESLHVIGQQLDHIEENIVKKIVFVEKPSSEKSVSVKTEKPLIDLPS